MLPYLHHAKKHSKYTNKSTVLIGCTLQTHQVYCTLYPLVVPFRRIRSTVQACERPLNQVDAQQLLNSLNAQHNLQIIPIAESNMTFHDKELKLSYDITTREINCSWISYHGQWGAPLKYVTNRMASHGWLTGNFSICLPSSAHSTDWGVHNSGDKYKMPIAKIRGKEQTNIPKNLIKLASEIDSIG